MTIMGRETAGIYVIVPLTGELEERNRKAFRMYFWLIERLPRDQWLVERLYNYANRYLIEDRDIAVLFKLTWGGR